MGRSMLGSQGCFDRFDWTIGRSESSVPAVFPIVHGHHDNPMLLCDCRALAEHQAPAAHLRDRNADSIDVQVNVHFRRVPT